MQLLQRVFGLLAAWFALLVHVVVRVVALLPRDWRALAAQTVRDLSSRLDDVVSHSGAPSSPLVANGGGGGTSEGWEREEARVLQEVHDIAGEASVESMLVRVRAAILRLLNVDRAGVLLVDEEMGVLRLIISSDANSATLPIHSGIAGAVVLSGKTLSIPDAYADPRFDRSIDLATGYRTRSILAVPVYAQDEGRVVAVLQALNKHEPPPASASASVSASASTPASARARARPLQRRRRAAARGARARLVARRADGAL